MQQLPKLTMCEKEYQILIWQTALQCNRLLVDRFHLNYSINRNCKRKWDKNKNIRDKNIPKFQVMTKVAAAAAAAVIVVAN